MGVLQAPTPTWENLDNAKTAVDKLISKIAALENESDKGAVDEECLENVLKARFKEQMDSDINTANGLTVLYDVLRANASAATKLAAIEDFDRVFSLDLIAKAKKAAQEQKDSAADIPQEVMALVEERKAARKAKDFAKADELRDKITSLGYAVKETRQGTEITKI